MDTPSFLVWALARHCPLRQIAGWENPERTERLLRAARAFDEARAEGRILDGVAIAAGAEVEQELSSVCGFRIEAALELYGGTARLHVACDACPANALRGHRGRQVVGCFGMWPLPADLNRFYEQVDAALVSTELPANTNPRWFGLWMNLPLASDACDTLARMLAALPIDDAASDAGRQELVIALEAAARHDISLYAQLYPRGHSDGPWWHLVPHCGRCQAEWSGSGPCRVCGQTAHPASPRKRSVRGQRPYVPLVRLLGEQQAAALLLRYRSAR
ncbi:MAG TPA: hypothetical protein VFB96_07980 [Pirellulaceae bacterium]|nr:hypothetical protein [Pirellulaceae bacterium]